MSRVSLRMLAAASRPPQLERIPGEGWWFNHLASERVVAGITDRETDRSRFLGRVKVAATVIEATQVHGGSVAVIERADVPSPIPGCDALLTSVPGIALLIRTADCLPIFFADPGRGVIGIAHAGWRGLSAALPARVVAAFRRAFHSQAEELQVVIGPAVHSCCYDVGPEFAARFGPFVEHRQGRLVCDLIGVAKDQLRRSGIVPSRLTAVRHCTGCEVERWFSVRREGEATGRLTSLIMLRP